jgi:deoxyhypusine synthase
VKKRYLVEPTEPLEVKERKISELVDAMRKTGFQGRKLAEAVETWHSMLSEDEIVILMGLSGAMVPAGMRRIISFFIRERMIDCIVSTGANIFHDLYEAMGEKHYLGSHLVNDSELCKQNIDRIYDVYADEEKFRQIDEIISAFGKTLSPDREYSSREFIYLLGKDILVRGGMDSIITSAAKYEVPIFVPALCDSSIGIGLTMMSRESDRRININQLKDVEEITQIVEQAGKTGVIYIGGGVPKNFIQQTEIVARNTGRNLGGHDYAIQFTTDMPQWGGLSGSTLEEAVSWGKIDSAAKKVQVHVDATIALPIVSHALIEKSLKMAKKRKKPRYKWGEKLELSFE